MYVLYMHVREGLFSGSRQHTRIEICPLQISSDDWLMERDGVVQEVIAGVGGQGILTRTAGTFPVLVHHEQS